MKYLRIFSLILSVLMTTAILGGCGKKCYIPDKKIEGSNLYVKKVDNVPENFIFGMDASSVLSEEASGVKYYNFDGEEQDVFKTLAESGVNYIRVRVWNNPFDGDNNGYGGGNCTIDTAVEIGKRATKYGMKLLLNFHYSDFWADPGKQMVPLEWKDMEIEDKADALYSYTKECLELLKDEKVDVGMVQLGNETNGKMCGETTWFNMHYLWKSGSKAVREVFPDALIAIHFANPEKAGSYSSYASKLDYYEIDYDVFASSYYPFWHGTLENLTTVLSGISDTYDKKVMVMETSYAYTPDDTDFNGNTISEGSAVTKNYPYTVQGQATCVRDVIDAVTKIPDGIGVVYWEGTWISVGTSSWEENHEKWEKYGSGWASSYAAVYDPDDAGKYYGGSAVDNQAMFGPDGKPLESLRIFNLVKYGNETEPKADAIEDVILTFDIGSEIKLPETVNALMTNGEKTEIPVKWSTTAKKLREMENGGNGKYEIEGSAEGMKAKAYISVVEFNYLENSSFENGDLFGWTLNEAGKADELYVEDKITDSLSGSWHMHFWSASQNSVEFSLEQEVPGLESGKYKYSISIMGGDCGKTEIYSYVKINGEIIKTCPMEITSYGNWDTSLIDGIEYSSGDKISVGIFVKCEGAGNGAWGKIDDAMLNRDMQ